MSSPLASPITRCHATTKHGKRCKHRTSNLYFCARHVYPTKTVLTSTEATLYHYAFGVLNEKQQIEYLEGIEVPKEVRVSFLEAILEGEDTTLWEPLSKATKEFFYRAALQGVREERNFLADWISAADADANLRPFKIMEEAIQPWLEKLGNLLPNFRCRLRCGMRRPRIPTPPSSPNLCDLLEPDLDDCDSSVSAGSYFEATD